MNLLGETNLHTSSLMTRRPVTGAVLGAGQMRLAIGAKERSVYWLSVCVCTVVHVCVHICVCVWKVEGRERGEGEEVHILTITLLKSSLKQQS